MPCKWKVLSLKLVYIIIVWGWFRRWHVMCNRIVAWGRGGRGSNQCHINLDQKNLAKQGQQLKLILLACWGQNKLQSLEESPSTLWVRLSPGSTVSSPNSRVHSVHAEAWWAWPNLATTPGEMQDPVPGYNMQPLFVASQKHLAPSFS